MEPDVLGRTRRRNSCSCSLCAHCAVLSQGALPYRRDTLLNPGMAFRCGGSWGCGCQRRCRTRRTLAALPPWEGVQARDQRRLDSALRAGRFARHHRGADIDDDGDPGEEAGADYFSLCTDVHRSAIPRRSGSVAAGSRCGETPGNTILTWMCRQKPSRRSSQAALAESSRASVPVG